jgi:CelD/BcsL family acetyltransferase involved in cellulose biosynthesis
VNVAAANEEKIAAMSARGFDRTEAAKTKSKPKTVYCIEPLKDSRWDGFLQRHPRSSLFHSSAWLRALSRTYGYQPIAYTTSVTDGVLDNAIVFCRVESWLTGPRLVSLPFSDHCDPLVDRAQDLEALTAAIEQESRSGRWRYVEIRPLEQFGILTPLRREVVAYAFHQLDLRPDLDTLFRNCHKSSTQRKIRRAEREGLGYREGSTEALLDHFYRSLKLTRIRHNLPPQPRKWFVNLMDCFGNDLKIRVAFKQDLAIAAMLTIRHKNTMVYKYGCCDSRFNNLGSMHLLYWRAIQDAKACGLRFFDLGRTDAEQQGLITFKNRWGASQSVLTYSRYCASRDSTHFFDLPTKKWKSKTAKFGVSLLPSKLIATIGRVIYRHIG